MPFIERVSSSGFLSCSFVGKLQREAAEKAKIELSSSLKSDINLPYLTADASGPKHFNFSLQRSKLENLISDFLKKTIKPVELCIKDAGLKKDDINEVLLVGGMTRMPKVQTMVENFFGRQPNRGVNPDEAVAIGAAIQGGVLKGDVKDIVLVDVAPLSLGIETLGGVFSRLIDRNTTIPTKKAQVFSTAADNQTQVSIRVFQGEREMANDNKFLGQFELVGIPPSPRGLPQIEVSFDIDANGIMKVAAKDKATNKDQHIIIQPSGGLSKDEIDNMIKNAEAMREEDAKRREGVELKNNLDTQVHNTEKSLSEHRSKLGADDLAAVEGALTEAKEAMNGEDLERMQTAKTNLDQAAMKIGQAMYANQQQNQETQEETQTEENQEDQKKD